MKDFSCSDINTGWRPVTREDGLNTPIGEPLLPDDLGDKDQGQYGMLMVDTHIREILRMLGEIQREIIFMKQLMIDMEYSGTAPKKKKLKPHKNRLARKLTI